MGNPVAWFQRWMKFLGEVKLELKRTTWPNRKEVRNTTLIVIVAVFIFATFLGVVDVALSTVLQRLLHYFGQ
jgi:preprotein translocase subunit SecE